MLPRIYRNDVDNRKHQINTLKVFNDNVSEIVEGTEYQILFNAGRNEFSLHVTLSSNFPQEKPAIKISPVVNHPWVNSEGEVISAPGLLNFTIHSDLGRVVQAIIREFERNPPPLVSNQTVITSKASSIPIVKDDQTSSSYSVNFPTLTGLSPPTHMPHATSAYQSSVFPELRKLSLDELQFLNENVDRQQEFIADIPQIKEQCRVLDELIDGIEELADSNLAKQKSLEDLKRNIETRLEESAKLAFENERLHGLYVALSQKYSPRNIQEQLLSAAQKADVESEKIAESFLNGEIDVDNFVTQYTKTRIICQARKTKEEKLSQQLDKLEKAGY